MATHKGLLETHRETLHNLLKGEVYLHHESGIPVVLAQDGFLREQYQVKGDGCKGEEQMGERVWELNIGALVRPVGLLDLISALE